MTKTELIRAVSKKSGITDSEAGKVVDAIILSVTLTLAAGESVKLSGLGTFEVKDRRAKVGRNPKTGEVVPIPETKRPAFRAGKVLKNAVK